MVIFAKNLQGSLSHAMNDENPVVEGWMRRHDRSQITDGAVTIFIANKDGPRKYSKTTRKPLEGLARIKGWGHTTAPMRLDTKLQAIIGKFYALPRTRKAINDAYKRAGIADIKEIDAIGRLYRTWSPGWSNGVEMVLCSEASHRYYW